MDCEKYVDLRARHLEAQPDDIRAALMKTELIRQRGSVWSTRCLIALTACAVAATIMLVITQSIYFLSFL